MPRSRINSIPKPLFVALVTLSLVMGVQAMAWANEEEPIQQATQKAAESTPASAPAVSGVTITWDLDNQRFQAPTAEQAARLAEEMRKLLEGKVVVGTKGLVPAEKIETEVLKNGTKRVRLPADLLNVSLVRLNEDGGLEEACADSPQHAHAVLNAPVSSNVEEN